MDAARIAAIIIVIVAASILLSNLPGIVGSVNAPKLGLVSMEENPGFLWTDRGLDLLIQAFVILAAAVAISAQFRRDEPRREVAEK